MAKLSARTIANRKNALKSTGPRTARGKARSRANALKHGLTGEGMCLPVEDAPKIQARVELLTAEFCPITAKELFYTQRAAIQWTRLDRCYANETFNLRRNVRDAIPNHDKRIFEDVRAIVEQLLPDPYGSVQRLKQSAEGIDWMVDEWRALRDSFAESGKFTQTELTRTDQLLGRRYDATGKSPFYDLNFRCESGLERVNGECRTSIEQTEACKIRSKLECEALLTRQIEDLLSHRRTLPLADAELSRQEAPMRAMVDVSNQGQLLRRYENAAAREVHKIFEYFDEIKAIEALENFDATSEPVEESVELASFGQTPEAEPSVVPEPEPEPAVEVVKTVAALPDGRPVDFGRFVGRPSAPISDKMEGSDALFLDGIALKHAG